MNWRARPLISHQVIVDLIAATTTTTGLTVQCVLDTSEYPIGVKYTKRRHRRIAADPPRLPRRLELCPDATRHALAVTYIISSRALTLHNDELVRLEGVPPMFSFTDPDGNGLVYLEDADQGE